MRACMYALQEPFPGEFFPALRTYSDKTFQMISFPTGKIFPDNEKQMLLAKALWIPGFHRLQQFWTCFSSLGAGATALLQQILPTSVQFHLWVLLMSLPFKNSFSFC